MRTAFWDSCTDVLRAVCCGAFGEPGSSGSCVGGGGGGGGSHDDTNGRNGLGTSGLGGKFMHAHNNHNYHHHHHHNHSTNHNNHNRKKKSNNDLGRASSHHLDVMESIRNKFESFTSSSNNNNNNNNNQTNISNDYRMGLGGDLSATDSSSSPSQTCTTITRPGYILQVPTVTSQQPQQQQGRGHNNHHAMSINETYSKSHKMFNDLGNEIYGATGRAGGHNHHQKVFNF